MASIPPIPNTQPIASTSRAAVAKARFIERASSFGAGLLKGGAADEFFHFPLKPLLPAIFATGLFFYQRGDERQKGHDPNPKTFQILFHLALATLLVLYTTGGFYVTLAGLKTAFDMGLQKDTMDKLKVVVQNVGVFSTAFVSILAGAIMAEASNQSDDKALRRSLKETSVQQWIQAHIGQAGAEGDMARHLHALHQQVTNLVQHHYQNRKSAATERDEKVIKKARATWLHLIEQPGLESRFVANGKIFRNLKSNIEHYQDRYVRLARKINPPVMGLLLTTFIGVPIIRRVNRWLETHHPELRGKQSEFFRFPELANLKGNYHGPGNAHALERGEGGSSHGGASEHGGGHDSGSHGPEFPGLSLPTVGTII